MKLKPALMLLSILLLVGCGDTQNAAYLIAGGQHSLTLTRQDVYKRQAGCRNSRW